MKGESRLRIGVIGLGKMGLLHASILNVLPGVQLSAICERNTRLARFAEKVFTGVRVVDGVEKLSGLNLDAIHITTPIPSHFPIIETIYSMGIGHNLFVEKTLASDYDQAMKLCQLAKAPDSVNMVGYMSRFAVTFKKTKELLNQGAIGEVISFKAYAYSSDFVGIKRKVAPRGGAIRDLGAHVIDLALWFFGDLEVKLAKLDLSVQGGPEDGGFFEVKGPNRLTGEFDISWRKEDYRSPEYGLTINGSKGTIKVDNDSVKVAEDDKSSLVWHRQNLDDSVAFLLGAPEYFREDEHFVKSILEGRSAEPSFFTASKVDYLIDQVRGKIS